MSRVNYLVYCHECASSPASLYSQLSFSKVNCTRKLKKQQCCEKSGLYSLPISLTTSQSLPLPPNLSHYLPISPTTSQSLPLPPNLSHYLPISSTTSQSLPLPLRQSLILPCWTSDFTTVQIIDMQKAKIGTVLHASVHSYKCVLKTSMLE